MLGSMLTVEVNLMSLQQLASLLALMTHLFMLVIPILLIMSCNSSVDYRSLGPRNNYPRNWRDEGQGGS